jgi:putative hydrolase of the HAD superfamily
MTTGAAPCRPAPPEAIFFDAAGTLIRVRRPVGEVYADHARRHGWNLPPDALATTFAAVFRRLPPPAGTGPDPERAWWERLVREVLASHGVEPAEGAFGEYFAGLWAHYADAAAWSAFPEAGEVLERLARRHPLGVVSNFDERLPGILEGLGLARHFRSLTLSGRVGARKPAARIFAAALASLGLEDGAGVIHVGDEPEADWQGARTAGLGWYELRRPERDLRAFEGWLKGGWTGKALTWREISLTFFASQTT